ncbi:MAG: hypothetical protein J6T01_02055 [Kiritimatiellae bacterium]|nr:hypothetical protein [Kiritimatiellia bacterium]
MKKRIPYVNEAVAERDFKYYIFDWDDNILHMPTKIRMEHLEENGEWKPVEVSTATFALVRTDNRHYRPPTAGGWAAAFANFADDPPPLGETGGSRIEDENNRFIRDTIDALERVEHGEIPGPSYNALKKTLREGRLFAIVTARGHSPRTIESAVRVFIKYALSDDERAEMMSSLRGYRRWIDGVADGDFGTDAEELDYYLGMCRYSAVTYKGFRARMAEDPIYRDKLASAPSAARPELAKEFAIRDFVEHVFHMLRRAGQLGRSVSIGFSDDDAGNVKSVSSFIKEELSKRFEGIKFVVYDTSDRTLDKGRKVCVSGQRNLPGF